MKMDDENFIRVGDIIRAELELPEDYSLILVVYGVSADGIEDVWTNTTIAGSNLSEAFTHLAELHADLAELPAGLTDGT